MARKNIDFQTYVKRDVTKSQVDWNAITDTVTTELSTIRDERKKKRGEIATATLEAEDTLQTLENYQSQEVGGLALQMSDQSAKFLRMSNKLLTNGLITPSEYAQRKQRVLSNWKQFGNATKAWDTQYSEWMTRQEDGNASSFESWMNSQNAAFGNLKNIQGNVNAETGALSLAKVGEDGTISKNPGDLVSVQNMNNRMSRKIQNMTKTLGAETKVLADGLGTVIDSIIEADSSVTKLTGYKDYMDPSSDRYNTGAANEFRATIAASAQEITAMPDKAMSILGDMMRTEDGGRYKPTYDKAEADADPTKVLMKIGDGNVMVVDEEGKNWKTQEQAATDFVIQKISSQLDMKREIDMSKYVSELDNDKFAEEIRQFDKKQLIDLRKTVTGEKRLLLDNKIATYTKEQGEAKIAISKQLADLKGKFQDKQIDQIDNIMKNADLSTELKYQQMILLDNRETAKLDFQKLLNLNKEEAETAENLYAFPDLSNSVTIDGEDYDDVFDYADDKLGSYIQMNDQWGNMDNFRQVENVTKNFITSSIDPELLLDLQKKGSFEVRFETVDSDRMDPLTGKLPTGRNVFNLDRLEVSVGGKNYLFPPEEGEAGYNEAKKLQKLINTNVGNGAPTQEILDWLEKHVLIPITEEGQELQRNKTEEEDEEELLGYRDFLRNGGSTGSREGDKAAYEAYKNDFNGIVTEEEDEEVEVEDETSEGDDIIIE
jgi:hypothetical protein